MTLRYCGWALVIVFYSVYDIFAKFCSAGNRREKTTQQHTRIHLDDRFKYNENVSFVRFHTCLITFRPKNSSFSPAFRVVRLAVHESIQHVNYVFVRFACMFTRVSVICTVLTNRDVVVTGIPSCDDRRRPVGKT